MKRAHHLRPGALLGPMLVFLAFASPADAVFPDPPSPYTHTVIVSQGPWDDPATWQKAPGIGDPIPGDGAVVHVPVGRRVTIRRQEPARVSFIRVDGELRLWIHSDTRLFVETLFVGPHDPGQPKTGTFMIGAACCPVKPGVTAEVVFISDGIPLWEKTAWDPKQTSRGLISLGQVRMYGQDKAHAYPVRHDAPAGTDTLTLELASGETVPRGWNAGDELVVAGTYFRRTGAATSSQDERRTLAAQPLGSSIAFAPLAFDRLRPDPSFAFHVANLTRNLVLRSESTELPQRGHVMFHSGDVDVRGVAFVGLGRTDKSIPLDDVIVAPGDGTVSSPSPHQIANPRGRYSVHFHLNGTVPGAAAPPSKVYDSVVVDSAGWSFVNHSSHVDFQRNVAYDFRGAGFVTEAGDELGNFFDNVAIRGTGNGEYRPLRLVFKNPQRPQPLSDFAFSGDGFWFQGPALRVRNNVASGCDGAGMLWFTTGAPDVTDVGPDGRNRYTGFDRTAAETVYGVSTSHSSFTPRHWAHGPGSSKLVISDLPILEMDGFEAYGNLSGFRARFNNHDNVDFYNEDPFDYDEEIVPLLPGNNRWAARLPQAIRNLTLWNNEQGLKSRYVTRTEWTDIEIHNALDYDIPAFPFRGHPGLELNFQLQSSSLRRVVVRGYPVAGWVENINDNVRNQFTYSGLDYDDYAQFDTWNLNALSCAAPTNLSAFAGSTTAALSWSSTNGKDERYLVRYRAVGEPHWRMADTTSTSLSVSGLAPGAEHEVQVVAGCCQPDASGTCGPGEPHSVSPWSEAGTFTTQ